ncbi:MAG TPA: chemotaxis protein CheD [Candidatus Binatia bacterium]|nr:chemotaxis protein CheD [Candidatus Binatia bacterium]
MGRTTLRAFQTALGEPLQFYLHPGHLFVSVENYAVTTILGSCVSVCLWDPETRIAGINHFLLPHAGEGAPASPRFGDCAVRQLIADVRTLGAAPERLQAKLFGGACVLEALRSRDNHLGAKNIAVARGELASAHIPVLGEDVGGCKGRKLIFHTDSGEAWVKEL